MGFDSGGSLASRHNDTDFNVDFRWITYEGELNSDGCKLVAGTGFQGQLGRDGCVFGFGLGLQGGRASEKSP